ncbi:recombination mediator RecR [Patescibacteria group bacterium]|nr:recombination mediator RecR [Patescibacteria group bacterium]
MIYPSEIQKLIDFFSHFPGIGPKAAQRFVFYLLRVEKEKRVNLAKAIKDLEKIKSCSLCRNFSDQDPCPLCRDPRRDPSLLLLVARPQDLMALEKSGQYQGLYYLLTKASQGTESNNFIENISQGLIGRLKEDQRIKELIFGFDLNVKGEGMALYLTNLINKDFSLKKRIKLSQMARGLPLGAEIEYADDLTLAAALQNRKSL